MLELVMEVNFGLIDDDDPPPFNSPRPYASSTKWMIAFWPALRLLISPIGRSRLMS